MKLFDNIYKKKYKKLEENFERQVNKRANEIYRERQTNWIVKEEKYKQQIRFNTLEIRKLKIKVKELEDYINKVLKDDNINRK